MINFAPIFCFLCSLSFNEMPVWAWSMRTRGKAAVASSTVRHSGNEVVTRRSILETMSTVTAASLLGLAQAPENTIAASSIPTAADLERIRKGHARVAYLLQNWDSITQVCGTTVISDSERKQVVRTEGGGGTTGCEKTPLNVQQLSVLWLLIKIFWTIGFVQGAEYCIGPEVNFLVSSSCICENTDHLTSSTCFLFLRSPFSSCCCPHDDVTDIWVINLQKIRCIE